MEHSLTHVIECFERSVRCDPDKVAVQYSELQLTYRDLDQRANSLAWQLFEIGKRPGDVIGICVEPGLATPIGLLGILKAGCAYMPLSVRDPKERLSRLIKNSGVSVLLAEVEQEERLNDLVPTFLRIETSMNGPNEGPTFKRADDQIAYILHTSGSTGQPKPVAVHHTALSHYLSWHINTLRKQADQLDLPLSSSICFAAGVTQFFTPLLVGSALHILPADVVRQPELLFAWYAKHSNYGLYCVPTLWAEMVRFAEVEHAANRNVTPPRVVLLSGEVLTESLVNQSFAQWPSIRLWNLYGPTEATANASAGEVQGGEEVTLGLPIADTELCVVDEDMTEVAPGMVGEILIIGPSVATGYFNLPDQSAERFLPSPHRDGCRMFRTGDFAKRTEGGLLRFIGRRDSMVKVRGHRVECGEIEAALLGYSTVRQVAVQKPDGTNTDLVAYVVLDDGEFALDQLRAYLAKQLPDFMIPTAIIILESFPTLANGKINRNAFPLPERFRPLLSYDYERANDDIESGLVAIWEEVLAVDGIGACDDFFDLGGTSLKAAAALVAIRENLGLKASFSDFFRHPTPRGLAKHAKPLAAALLPLRLLPEHAPRLCYNNQQSLWVLEQTFPRQPAYSIQFAVRFEGSLDLLKLRASLEDLLRRHLVLRSNVIITDGVPMMATQPAQPILLDPIDIDNDKDIALLMEAERHRPFDLAYESLIRFALCRQAEEMHQLVVTTHHFVFDGTSIAVFVDDLCQTYEAMALGLHASAPVEPGFAEWAAWRSSLPELEGFEHSLSFWRDLLADCPRQLALIPDYPRPEVRQFKGSVAMARIEAPLMRRLLILSQEMSATLFMTMLAVFDVLLFRHTDQRDFAVGVPIANRDRQETEEMVGYFANTLALRCRLDKDLDFRLLLAMVRETVIAALDHQGVPFEEVLRTLHVERHASYSPVFQAMFALHETPPSRRVTNNLTVDVLEITNDIPKFDLSLEGHMGIDGIDLRLIHSHIYAADRMQLLLNQYCHLLEEVSTNPDRTLSTLPLISEAVIAVATSECNATSVERPQDIGLHRLFECQATATPDQLALIAEAERLTYQELDGRANQFARYLLKQGIGRGDAVGIALRPGSEIIVSMLAILKIGAAYVPLDPLYPAERLAYIVGDAGVKSFITSTTVLQSNGLNSFNGVNLITYDLIQGEVESLPRTDGISVVVSAEELAYIIYTSGSSGQPKGVLVHHEGPSNYVLWMSRTFGLNESDRILWRASINFDISVWEIFLPLVSGATMVVAGSNDIKSPDVLAALIEREAVTHVQFVPSALRTFVDSGALARCSRLKCLFSGGEALSLQLQNDIFKVFSGELHNLYGPTEASIYSCHWACRRNERRRVVPIGGPIDNTQIHILDSSMKHVAPGTSGELYIGGVGVALGYRNKPEQTRRDFIPDPFSTQPNARLFRTGDQACELDRGLIVFLGRSDGQVKVRGHRIELGDIEHNLASHPGVRQVKVIIRKDHANDDVRIVAYIIPLVGVQPSEKILRDHLRLKLPDFMIPQHFIMIPELPLLPNNKINIKALPRPVTHPKTISQTCLAGDRISTLSAIWAELLGTNQFGPNDNFFDVGGYSLLLVRLAALINDRLKTNVTTLDLFRYPSIAAMDRHLSNRSNTSTSEIVRKMARRATPQP
ncbi:MAG: amino acid adenylation domain-containing protein [Cyanobacteriota bacterium]|jgi:amino acid adenylation domain-containing protein